MTLIFDEYLEIDGLDLANQAWWVESLAPLFSIQKRGNDKPMPGAAGARALKRRTTSLSVSLTLYVYGDVDPDGTPFSDARQGLYENLRSLEDDLLADVADTRTAIWHLPTGSTPATRTAEVHVEAFTVKEGAPTEAKCSLELTFPAGRWTDVP